MRASNLCAQRQTSAPSECHLYRTSFLNHRSAVGAAYSAFANPPNTLAVTPPNPRRTCHLLLGEKAGMWASVQPFFESHVLFLVPFGPAHRRWTRPIAERWQAGAAIPAWRQASCPAEKPHAHKPPSHRMGSKVHGKPLSSSESRSSCKSC